MHMAHGGGSPAFDDLPRLTEAFPRASLDAWGSAAQRTLGTRPLENLTVATHEGLSIKPLYSEEDLPPDRAKIRSHNRDSWKACSTVDLRGGEAAIGEAATAVSGGASALWLIVDRRSSSWSRLTAGMMTRILEAASGASIYLDGRAVTPALAAVVAASAKRIGDPAKDLRGGFDFDPLGTLAADGSLPWSLEACFWLMSDMVQWCEAQAQGMKAIAISTLSYARGGATAVQELAFALATGAEYLRHLEIAGIGPERACPSIRLIFAVGRDLFMEVAKFRAARLLWARVAQACGLPAADRGVEIHAVASPRCLTARDPWVNMLRGTAEAYAAVVGCADVVTVLPFDSALGAPDEAGRRMALNTQNILREECRLDVVRDPAAGSYFVECLTHELAAAAWDRFQQIEIAGGMANQMRTGAVSREVGETLASKRRAIALRRDLVTGVSSYPNLEEERPTRRRSDRGKRPFPDEVSTAVHRAVGSSSVSFEGAVENASEGVSVRDLIHLFPGHDEPTRMAALPAEREAIAFERLRDASDKHLHHTGARPHVFLAAVGSPADHGAKVALVVNLLAAGGVTVVRGEGLEGVADSVAAYEASSSRTTVVCAPDELIPDLARTIKSRGAHRVLVAGRPGAEEDRWRIEGVDGYVFDGCDAIALLSDIHEMAGLRRA
jgi:methylmalonyl-CoA mutase